MELKHGHSNIHDPFHVVEHQSLPENTNLDRIVQYLKEGNNRFLTDKAIHPN
jgi:hypothetical protein